MKKYLHYLVFAILLFLIISMTRSTIGFWGKMSKIDEAEEKVAKLKMEQQALLEIKKDVDTEAFIEKEARERLGLAKEGDTVLILPPDEVLKKFAPKIEDELRQEELPIYKRWVRLFFRLGV